MFRLFYFICIAFVIFSLGGIYSGIYPKSNIFRQSWVALKQVANIVVADDDGVTVQGRVGESGVTKYNPQLASNGYTAYTLKRIPVLNLIDMHGNVVYKWDFHKVFENFQLKTEEIRGTPSIRRGLIHPNGDVTFILSQEGVTPYGGYAGKLDKNGNVQWIYEGKPTHHDLDLGSDGKVYLITHEMTYHPTPENGISSDPVETLEDYVTILNSEGKEIKSVSIYDLLKKYPEKIVSEFDVQRLLKEKLDLGNGGGATWFDPTHANTIVFVTEEFAEQIKEIEPGNVLVNLRELNIIISIDLDKEVINWVTSGPWLYSHEAQLLKNGNIMIFDNLGIDPYARIIEYDPKNDKVVWKFEGSEKQPFASETVGMQQTLENGNVVIAESYGGRIFEVNRDGEIVWEFKSPKVLINKDGLDITLLPFANRYFEEDVKFLKNQETAEGQHSSN